MIDIDIVEEPGFPMPPPANDLGVVKISIGAP
jgi:hypothetical protein